MNQPESPEAVEQSDKEDHIAVDQLSQSDLQVDEEPQPVPLEDPGNLEEIQKPSEEQILNEKLPDADSKMCSNLEL